MRILIIISFLVSFFSFAFAQDQSTFDQRLDYLLKNSKPNQDGPNCWNSVLFLSGISPGIAYSTGEIVFWLNSPLCKEVGEKDIKRGDIINLRSDYDGEKLYSENHSFMYLGEEQYFTKDGTDRNNTYKKNGLNEILKEWSSNQSPPASECRFVGSKEGLQSGCSDIITAYRCESIESYLIEASNDTQKDFSEFKEVSHCVTKYLLEQKLDESFEENIIDLVKPVKELALSKLGYVDYDVLPGELRLELSRYFEAEREWFEDEVEFQSFRKRMLELFFIYSIIGNSEYIQDNSFEKILSLYSKYNVKPEAEDFNSTMIYVNMYFSGSNIVKQFEEL